MKPKEKAIELVNNHLKVGKEKIITDAGVYYKTIPFSSAQVHAIITVEQMLSEWENELTAIDGTLDVEFWRDVRNEIENL